VKTFQDTKHIHEPELDEADIPVFYEFLYIVNSLAEHFLPPFFAFPRGHIQASLKLREIIEKLTHEVKLKHAAARKFAGQQCGQPENNAAAAGI
jgi:hypothetical protein